MTFFGITKPSQAIRAMVVGIRQQSRRKKFVVNMTTYGLAGRDGICYGCAATCTIQKLARKNFKPKDLSSKIVNGLIHPPFLTRENVAAEWGNTTRAVVSKFEHVINEVRQGRLKQLFEFFELGGCIPPYITYYIGKDYVLLDGDYLRNLPNFLKLAARLEKDGF